MITPESLKLHATKKPPEKIGENHVIVRFVLFSEDGTEVLIGTEEYGQNRIDKEREEISLEMAGIDDYKEKKLYELNAEKTELQEIQTEMDRKL